MVLGTNNSRVDLSCCRRWRASGEMLVNCITIWTASVTNELCQERMTHEWTRHVVEDDVHHEWFVMVCNMKESQTITNSTNHQNITNSIMSIPPSHLRQHDASNREYFIRDTIHSWHCSFGTQFIRGTLVAACATWRVIRVKLEDHHEFNEWPISVTGDHELYIRTLNYKSPSNISHAPCRFMTHHQSWTRTHRWSRTLQISIFMRSYDFGKTPPHRYLRQYNASTDNPKLNESNCVWYSLRLISVSMPQTQDKVNEKVQHPICDSKKVREKMWVQVRVNENEKVN